MPRPEIDLLHQERTRDSRSPFSFKLGRNLLITAFIVIVCLVLVIAPILIRVDTRTITSASINFFKQIVRIVTNKDIVLRGEDQDRINIVLLGIGGEGHEGAYLSDTMILASFKPSTKQVSLISIPRDLWVPIPGYGFRKVNNAYAFGVLNNPPAGGLELARQTVSRLVGQNVHYVAEIDFSGFEKIIDVLGGVDIEVERSFVDTTYPTNEYGVYTVSFEKGVHHFDGKQALIFVRSRHGTNGEGSDFARSRRQQKVLVAVKEKLLKTGVLLNPNKIGQLLDLVGKNTNTDIGFSDVIRLAQIARGIDKEQIISKSIDEASGLVVPAKTEDGAFILKPRLGFSDFTELQALASTIFMVDSASSTPKSVTLSEIRKVEVVRKVGIVVQNGTSVTGLGRRMAERVSGLGSYNIVSIDNALKRDYEKNVIYDLTQGARKEATVLLAKKINANMGNTSSEMRALFAKDADFLIIVGTNHGLDQ